MIFQLCLSIFISSAAIFESTDGKGSGLDISYKASVHRGGGVRVAAAVVDGEGGRRQKRGAYTILDGTMRKNVVTAFSDQRALVGASNMNYVGWDSSFEDAAINWTSGCNYNAGFNPPSASYVIRAHYDDDYTSADVVEGIFNATSVYYAMRSTYVTGICAVKSTCSPAIVNGVPYAKHNLYIIILPYASGFNETVPQYTIGPACSNCSTGIIWCYYNLCTASCDLNTPGCCQITASKTMGTCATPTPTTPTSTMPNGPKPSVSPSINTSKFKITLLGLMSVLFAIAC